IVCIGASSTLLYRTPARRSFSLHQQEGSNSVQGDQPHYEMIGSAMARDPAEDLRAVEAPGGRKGADAHARRKAALCFGRRGSQADLPPGTGGSGSGHRRQA
ncbi:MAG: hypothetical protein ABSD48_16340, partial [Armatimonadota bacterium]